MNGPLDRDLDRVLDATPDTLSELRDARILLTGGTGFFGGWLLEYLLRSNDARGVGAKVT